VGQEKIETLEKFLIFQGQKKKEYEMSDRSNSGNNACGLGLMWIAGWLFTIGFLGHGFWQGLIALVLWPYQIGASLPGF
jgi:hypothetical protein